MLNFIKSLVIILFSPVKRWKKERIFRRHLNNLIINPMTLGIDRLHPIEYSSFKLLTYSSNEKTEMIKLYKQIRDRKIPIWVMYGCLPSYNTIYGLVLYKDPTKFIPLLEVK